jgi:spoIIIJ-associated protein
MPAMERRIVHLALAEHDTVRTQSVGVEPNRRVVILPANKVD